MSSVIPCYRSVQCSFPACDANCDGRPGAENTMLERLAEFDHPFTANDDGLWCDGCGDLVAAPWNITETYVPPDNCKKCGWPDEFDPEAV